MRRWVEARRRIGVLPPSSRKRGSPLRSDKGSSPQAREWQEERRMYDWQSACPLPDARMAEIAPDVRPRPPATVHSPQKLANVRLKRDPIVHSAASLPFSAYVAVRRPTSSHATAQAGMGTIRSYRFYVQSESEEARGSFNSISRALARRLGQLGMNAMPICTMQPAKAPLMR